MRDFTIAGSKGLDLRFAACLAVHETRPPDNMLYVDGYSNVANLLAIPLLLSFTGTLLIWEILSPGYSTDGRLCLDSSNLGKHRLSPLTRVNFPSRQSAVTAVNKKSEPPLRSECNVFARTDSIYDRLICCYYSGARKSVASSTMQED